MPETQASTGPGRSGAPAVPPPDILRRIVETKREELAALRGGAADLWARARDRDPARGFARALGGRRRVGLVAEVKRRSPGAGDIRPDLDPVALAADYAGNGAAAVSVLTDLRYFGGSLDDLRAVRERVSVPVLRKDFTIDALHLAEAAAAGADAVLLIVRILDDPLLGELREQAVELGMDALVEVHDRRELERALAAGADLVGINNRDLATFTTDLSTTEDLLDLVPPGAVLVSESGVRTAEDVSRLGARGVDAVLVGESLLRAEHPGRHAAELSAQNRRPRERPAGR